MYYTPYVLYAVGRIKVCRILAWNLGRRAGKIRLVVGLKLKYKLEVIENVEEFAVLCGSSDYMCGLLR